MLDSATVSTPLLSPPSLFVLPPPLLLQLSVSVGDTVTPGTPVAVVATGEEAAEAKEAAQEAASAAEREVAGEEEEAVTSVAVNVVVPSMGESVNDGILALITKGEGTGMSSMSLTSMWRENGVDFKHHKRVHALLLLSQQCHTVSLHASCSVHPMTNHCCDIFLPLTVPSSPPSLHPPPASPSLSLRRGRQRAGGRGDRAGGDGQGGCVAGSIDSSGRGLLRLQGRASGSVASVWGTGAPLALPSLMPPTTAARSARLPACQVRSRSACGLDLFVCPV